MKELDLLLGGYLEGHYASATTAERAAFRKLLDLPDPQLAAYLLADEAPIDPTLAALVRSMARR